jgi:hypothetical protein
MTAIPAALGATDAAAAIGLAQRSVMHTAWAAVYGATITPDRADEPQLRPAAAVIEQAATVDAPAFGVCRHYAVVATAALRAGGVPARARCGFARYFEAGKHVDHWVVERWDAADARWVRFDPQLDEVQLGLIAERVDPLDLAVGAFLTGGEAWQACRRGDLDPETFGIFDMWGSWFIAGNVVRDLAALNKVEMLPWDVWGAMTLDSAAIDHERIDELAAIAGSGSVEALRAAYASDDVRVPPVVNAMTEHGPRADDVREVTQLYPSG